MGIPGTKVRNPHCKKFGGDSVQWGFRPVGIPSSGDSGYIPFSIFCTNELPASRAPLKFPAWITTSRHHVHTSSSHTVSHATPPVPRLHHVLPSSSLAASRAPLQFPDCITCYPPDPKMYHVPPPPPPISHLTTLGEVNYLHFPRLLLLLISH